MDVDVSAMGDDSRRQVESVVCGIDPGRDKFGIALCGDALVFSAVVPIGALDDAVRCVADGSFARVAGWTAEGTAPSEVRVSRVFLGSGTGRGAYERALADAKVKFEIVDERGTTLEARGLYWRLHPPRGISALLPISLRVPPRSIDDLAAWAIAKRGETT